MKIAEPDKPKTQNIVLGFHRYQDMDVSDLTFIVGATEKEVRNKAGAYLSSELNNSDELGMIANALNVENTKEAVEQKLKKYKTLDAFINLIMDADFLVVFPEKVI